MPMIKLSARIVVCTDCILILANGCDDCTHDFPHECHAAKMSDSEITPGCGECDGDCTEQFSAARCECCGESLAGDRHCATTWWSERTEGPERWYVWDHNVGHRVWSGTPDDIPLARHDAAVCPIECYRSGHAPVANVHAVTVADCVTAINGDGPWVPDAEHRTVTIARGTAHLGSDAAWSEIAACEGVREISDASAVTVASWWQGPRGPASTFAALVSHCPVTVADLCDAIAFERSQISGYGRVADRDRLALSMLATWALNRGREV